MPNCAKCNAEMAADLKICPSCGTAVPPPQLVTVKTAFGLGDLVVIAGALLVGFSGLLCLIYTLDSENSRFFHMTTFAIITLMFSAIVPLGIVVFSLKKPELRKLNYVYAGYIWLMKYFGVSVMIYVSQAGNKFIGALDFWMLSGAALIAAGTCISLCSRPKA